MLVRFSPRQATSKRTPSRNRVRPRLEILEERLVLNAPSPGLVSWWQGEGNAQDTLGVNQGQASVGVDYTAGVVGQAFHFGAAGNQVSATTINLPTGSAARSLDLWARLDRPVGSGEAFFAGYGNFGNYNQTFQLGANSNNEVFFSQWGQAITGPALNVGRWYNVAVTYDGSTATLYLNGQAVGSSNSLPINTPTGTSFYLGSDNNDPARQLIGAEDEVAVFNRSLSAGDVQSIYLAGSAGLTLATPPTVTLPGNATVREGLTWTASGSFTSAITAQTFTATVNYGDGTGVQALPLGANDTFTLQHTYAQVGADTVTVSVTDSTGHTGTAHLVATVAPNVGLLLTDASGQGALTMRGDGNLVVKGNEAIVLDSTSAQAALLSGSAHVSAEELDVAGTPGVSTTGHAQLQAQLNAGFQAIADPLAALPAPPLPGQTFTGVHIAGHKGVTLQPGTYVGGISVSGDAEVKLQPGIYYLQGGALSVGDGGCLEGSGVVIYLAPGSSGVSVRDSGHLTLSAPTSGTYQGIALFEDRTSTSAVNVTGDGVLALNGTLYAARARIVVSADGVLTDTAPAIVADLTVEGHGQVKLGQPVGIQLGQTASAAFWGGVSGQQLLTSLNGAASSKALGNWLASTFGNLYGRHAGSNDLAGLTNAQVATYFESLLGANSQGLQVQVLATALNVYATTERLGGTAAVPYGFLVNYDGLGANTVNVGTNGAAFHVADHHSVSVLQALQAVNRQSRRGVLYNGNKAVSAEALTVFAGINGPFAGGNNPGGPGS